jgi:predicted permease
MVKLLSRLRAAGRNLVRRDDVERELDDELRAYVDALTAEKIARGMSSAAARRAALVEAGGTEQTKETVRDARAGAWLDALARDVRHTLRGLARAPGFTIAVVATLAIGIGLNSAVFTIVYAALARPLPVRDAGRIVNVYQRLRSGGPRGREVRGASWLVSYEEFQRYAQLPAFASAAAFHAQGLTVTGADNRVVSSELVSCGYFRTLRVRMALGRGFSDDECDHPGTAPVVVMSDAAWQAWYGADSSVVGRIVHVNGSPMTVVGVAERGFNGVSYQRASMWVPLTMQPALEHGRDSILVHDNASWLTMVARLAPDATLDQARAQATVTGGRLDAMEPGRRTIPLVVPGAILNFPEVSSRGGVPLALTSLVGLTIVAIACANVMNLLLARGLARRREIAIRLAIGAPRRQLVRQLLIESGLLSFSGALIGLAFVFGVSPAFRWLSPLSGLQVNVAPDFRVIAYMFVVATTTTMLVGLTPAVQTTRLDLATAFKDTAPVGARQLRPSRIRSAIVGAQMAGSALLLAIAGLFLRGAIRASAADPGYATRNVVAFSTNAAPLGYDAVRATILYRALMDRIRQVPGVVDVAIAGRLPLLSRNSAAIRIDRGTDTAVYVPDVSAVSASYFRTMDMRIVRGSTFDTTSVPAGERPVVISGSLATILWPQQDALGQRLKSGDIWFRVVGIASEAAASSLERPAEPIVYFMAASPLDKQIVVRTSRSPAALIASVPAWARALDPALLVQSERFEDRIALVLLPGRLVAASTAALGALALLLAAIGIAGVVSFGVGQRRREIAVRLAVGASPRQVVTLMMRQGITPVIAGIGAGLALSVAIGFVVRGLLFGVSPLDPIAYVAMVALLALSALLATYVPSRRAAAVDPAWTLRDDG